MEEELMFLVFGSSGWIGGMVCALLEKYGKKVVRASSRLEDRQEIIK
jgi:hypothetical protein